MTKPKLKSGDSATEVIGRRFTKRAVEVFHGKNGESRHEKFDRENHSPRIAERKAAAIEFLEAHQVPASELLAQSPGGTLLIEQVIHIDANEWDSPLGIAALIARACSELEGLLSAGVASSRAIGMAFELGRLSTLTRVYEIDEGQRNRASMAGAAAAKSKASQNLEAVRSAFEKLPDQKRGRDATALIVRQTGLSDDTVREYLKSIKASNKTG